MIAAIATLHFPQRLHRGDSPLKASASRCSAIAAGSSINSTRIRFS
jgi:hypothetical protein